MKVFSENSSTHTGPSVPMSCIMVFAFKQKNSKPEVVVVIISYFGRKLLQTCLCQNNSQRLKRVFGPCLWFWNRTLFVRSLVTLVFWLSVDLRWVDRLPDRLTHKILRHVWRVESWNFASNLMKDRAVHPYLPRLTSPVGLPDIEGVVFY